VGSAIYTKDQEWVSSHSTVALVTKLEGQRQDTRGEGQRAGGHLRMGQGLRQPDSQGAGAQTPMGWAGSRLRQKNLSQRAPLGSQWLK
jgi:hypothetical protein